MRERERERDREGEKEQSAGPVRTQQIISKLSYRHKGKSQRNGTNPKTETKQSQSERVTKSKIITQRN